MRRSPVQSPPPAAALRHAGATLGALLFAAGLLLWRLDPGLDLALHHRWLLHADAPALVWLRRLTDLGGAAVLIPVALVACALLGWRGRGRAALWLFATIASGRLIVEGAKLLFVRARPPEGDWLSTASSFSFPSSHSAGSMLTVLAICLAARAPRPVALAALAFALAIGATRVMLGMHWPSDVLAGWGFGLFWASACAAAVSPDRSRGSSARSAGVRA